MSLQYSVLLLFMNLLWISPKVPCITSTIFPFLLSFPPFSLSIFFFFYHSLWQDLILLFLLSGIDSFSDVEESSDSEVVRPLTAESVEHLCEEMSQKYCGIRGLKSTIGLTDFTGRTKKLFVHPYSQVNLSPLPLSIRGISPSRDSCSGPWSVSSPWNSVDEICTKGNQTVVKVKERNRSRGK